VAQQEQLQAAEVTDRWGLFDVCFVWERQVSWSEAQEQQVAQQEQLQAGEIADR
jgi:hypothetical protein